MKLNGGPHFCLKCLKVSTMFSCLSMMVWDLLLLVSSDKAIKHLKNDSVVTLMTQIDNHQHSL